MQRIGSLLGYQVLVLIFVGCYAWARQSTGGDDYDSVKRLMASYGYGVSPYKRLPSYEFGLGKRSFEEPSSYEDNSAPDSIYTLLEKKANPSKLYSFGLGKRNRAYGFGLGKRLEQAWKANAASSLTPAYRYSQRFSAIPPLINPKSPSTVFVIAPDCSVIICTYGANAHANTPTSFQAAQQ